MLKKNKFMILITGASGLVGAHIVLDLIINENKVRALKRKNSSLKYIKTLFKNRNISHLWSKIEWVNGDLGDYSSLEPHFENIKSVYHIGGFVSVGDVNEDKKKLRDINVGGTKNIIELSIKYNVNSLLFMSSISTVNAPQRKYINDYTISKLLAENIVMEAILSKKINGVIVNPGVIISEGIYNRSSGRVINECSKGIYTSGQVEIILAEDVSTCCITLMQKKLFNSKYILFSENISYENMVKTICNNKNIKTRYLSDNKLKLIYFISNLLSYLGVKKKLNSNVYETLTYIPSNSNNKILEAMGKDFKFKMLKEKFPSIL